MQDSALIIASVFLAANSKERSYRQNENGAELIIGGWLENDVSIICVRGIITSATL